MNIVEELTEMNINDFKNDILSNMQEYVTDTAKKSLLVFTSEKVLPAIKEVGESYIKAIKETAEHETGWCKVRDVLVIPSLISIAIWVAEQSVAKVVALDEDI